MSIAYVFTFTVFAEKRFLRLDKQIQIRVRAKLEEMKHHEDIESLLKKLIDFGDATHRLRIGEFRVILQKTSETDFLVLDIGHRKDVYR